MLKTCNRLNTCTCIYIYITEIQALKCQIDSLEVENQSLRSQLQSESERRQTAEWLTAVDAEGNIVSIADLLDLFDDQI